jgi:transcriptional regulator with XRE-family HTH domain
VKKSVGEKIRRIRESKGFSRERVADELNITHGAYSKIERGESDPNTQRLEQIAKILKVSIIDFFEDVAVFSEDSGKYGYATKAEVENISKLVSILVKEIEKLREELLKAKPATRKKNKKS